MRCVSGSVRTSSSTWRSSSRLCTCSAVVVPFWCGMDVHRVLALGHGAAQVVEAAVAGDPVEPRPHVDLALVLEHRRVGVGEDLLEDVLGVLAALQHRLAEAEQAGVVAVEQRLEGAVVAGPDQLDEALVGLAEKRPNRTRSARCCVWPR